LFLSRPLLTEKFFVGARMRERLLFGMFTIVVDGFVIILLV
jgi:hypothetical protein